MSFGRGRQMELIAAMAKSAREQATTVTDSGSAESGIQTTDKSHGTSEEKKEAEVTKDSGEDSLGTSSLGRGRMMKLATERLREKQQKTSEEESGSSRASGSREAMKKAMEAIRQYHEPKEKIQGQMSTLSLEEPVTQVPQDVVSYRGVKGSPVKVMANYLPLKWRGNQRIYEYVVQFEPPIDSIHLRVKIIQQLQPQIGIFVFSGFNIFLTRKLETISHYKTTLASTQDTIKVTMKLVKQKPEEELSPFLNNLFNKVMRELKFVRHKRKQFDPTKAKLVPQHKLEIWPGYVTAVDTFEGGLMLSLDVSHRRLSTMTVLELMSDIHQTHPQNFHKKVKETLVGKVVLTRYNNQTYCIHDVDFNLSPKSTFQRNGEEINFIEYYRRNYNITIRDVNQPLLMNFKEVLMAGQTKKQERTSSLIPELCYLTGLTDEQMNNQNLKRDLITYVQVSPQHRVEGLRKFLSNVQECEAARKVLEEWGLELAPDVLTLEGRELGLEMVNFDGYQGSAGVQADFSRDATNKRVLSAVPLTDWAIYYAHRNRSEATTFLEHMQRSATNLGMNILQPQHIVLQQDQTIEFQRRITESLSQNPNFSLIVVIFPTQRADLYACVKKICCYQIPIPSQVIIARTLNQRNESKVKSIVMKILLQMNCKVGGTLWSVNIPLAGSMICGIDAYHDPAQKSSSVTGFVASTNKNFTKWFSTVIIQNIREEVSRSLGNAVKEALLAYRVANGTLPERIVIFRDGVGDGQLQLCEQFEVPQLIEATKMIYPNQEPPKLTYVVTQKRINTRFFRARSQIDNPAPGTVVDHSVTRRYLKDFFLISQNVRQGTVTPSHYIIVWDSANLSADIIQKLAYKLTFMYYNWPGTIRVPACCQYAHKLAYLVGEHVKKEPAKKLQDKLFYL